MKEIVRIKNISEVHKFYGFEPPKHPLVSLLPIDERMTSFDYDDANRTTTRSYGNSTQSSLTYNNRNRVLQWAYNVSPDGGTDPQGALKQALELEPDVVFFLTDGDIPDTTRRTVKRHRKGTTVVNTICVGSHAATELMKEIAINSGGQFVAVR